MNNTDRNSPFRGFILQRRPPDNERSSMSERVSVREKYNAGKEGVLVGVQRPF